jgi:hypothetical protein
MSDDVRTMQSGCWRRLVYFVFCLACLTYAASIARTQGPTPAPTSPVADDEIKFGSTTNIMGMSIFILIILVIFMCAGSLIW